MATAQTIINRALRLCRVLDSNIAATANECQDALEVLNAMLAEWHEAGVGLPDYSMASLSTALGSDSADSDAVAYQLAIRLAPEYGKELTPLTLGMAESSMARLRLRYFQPGDAVVELPSATHSFNITTGDA